MNKIVKISLIVFTTLILLAILTVIALTQFINPNDYKSDIEDFVQKETGLTLAIRGNIAWQLYPSLGVGISELHLSNPSYKAQTKIVSVNLAEIDLALMPLLSNRIAVNKINLVKPTLYLHRNQDGILNIGPLLDEDSKDDANEVSTDIKDDNLNINIDNVSLEQAIIHWKDEQEARELSIEDVNLQVQDFQLNKSFPVHLSLKVNNSAPRLQGDLNVDSLVQLTPKTQQFKLDNFDLTFAAQKTPFSDQAAHYAAHMDALHIDQKNALYTVKAGFILLDDAKILGDMSSTLDNGLSTYRGDLQIPKTKLRHIINKLAPEYLSQLPADTLQSLEASIHFSGTSEDMRIEPIAAKLDNVTLKGDAQLQTNKKTPELNINMHVNAINLDKYLPKAEQEKKAEAKTAPTTEATQAQTNPIAVNALLSIDRLKVANVIAGKVSASMHYNEGIFRVDPFSALLYDGVLQGSLSMNTQAADRPWQLQNTLKNLNIQDFLTDYANNESLTGRLNIQADLTSSLNETQDYKSKLNGNIQLDMNNGFYQGMDLEATWLEAKNLVQRKNIEIERDNGTTITHMGGSLQIENGIGRTQNFVLYNPTLFTQGHGQFDLAQDSIQFNLVTYESLASQDQTGKTSYQPKNERGLPIEVGCKLTAPCTHLDKEALAKMAIQSAGSKLLDKVFKRDDSNQGDTQQNLNPTEQLLRGIFGN